MSFTFSKIVWSLIAPGSLLALLLIVGLILTTAPRVCYRKLGRFFCIFTAVCYLALTFLPVGEWAITPLENHFTFDPPEQVDGIIVIGGDEKPMIAESRGTPLVALDSMRRYVEFADMARRYPDAKLVFSGGPPYPRPNAKMEDSDVARAVLADIGLPTGRMIFEKTSRNTYENAVFSADLVRPDQSQKWLLVTSAWHMPRAIGCFRRAGWNVYAAPTGYFTTGSYHLHAIFRFDEQLHMLTLAMHEYVGLFSYWLMGRTDALWPPQNQN